MIKIYDDFIQGSDEWHAVRCGMLTASEMRLIITPTLKAANNEKEKSHMYELLAQRVTKYVEPRYVNDDMLRGSEDENEALRLYLVNYAPVKCVGFITNNKWGFTLGYSPDAICGDNGIIEVKSRRQKFQMETYINNVLQGLAPPEFMIQIQAGLLVSERGWCDFISYSGGLPMAVIRVYPDQKIQDAILEAASNFEDRIKAAHERYIDLIGLVKMIPTERRIVQEMFT